MCGRTALPILISCALLLTGICGTANANIAGEPAGGIAADGNLATYLKNAQVFINVEDECGNGTGLYTIHNPSNDIENLIICFYSGSVASDVSIVVNGYRMPTEFGSVSRYWGPEFEVMVLPHSFSNISVKWNFSISEDSGTRFTSKTSYVARYLIIGNYGWNHSIDNVEVTFRLNSRHFRTFTANSGYTASESDGATVLSYRFTNFDYYELELTVRGDSFTWDIWAISATILICAIAVVAFALHRFRRIRD